MRLKFGQLTLIPLGILLSLPSCGKKSAENEGFLPKLSEITKDDVLTDAQIAGGELWAKVVEALKIVDIDRTSSASVTTSLKSPSSYITDATLATSWAASRVGTIVADAASQKCSGITAMVDLVPGTNYSITGNGAFKLGGTDGKTPTKLLTDTSLNAFAGTLTAKVYLMKYKLQGDTSDRNALVTIPDKTGAEVYTYAYGGLIAGGATTTVAAATATAAQAGLTVAPDTSSGYGYPVVFYAHAGATGLAYEEIAQTFGDMQASHIIVAPVFPGENFCVTYDTDATTGGKIPSCSGSNIGAAAVGTSNPYVNDVTDLLGTYECIKSAASSTTIPVLNAAGTATGYLPAFNTKYAKVSAAVSTAAAGYASAFSSNATAAAAYTKIAGLATYPVSYAVGLGRGAAVANLAVARGGAINSVQFSTATDEATVAAQSALTTAGVTPGMFSCSISGAPQATFTAGLNKIILDYWVRGESDFLTEAKQAALDRIPGFAIIKANIAALKAGTGTQDEIAASIATYVESIDTTYHTGLIHGGLQNWGKVLNYSIQGTLAKIYTTLGNTAGATTAATTAGKTLAAAQGSALVLHGTSDIVASVSNSQLMSAIAVSTSTSLEAATTRTVGGVNWLALGIAPPDGVTVDGVSDVGHVSSVSFLTGKAVEAATSSMTSDSSYTIADYVGKTPVEIIASWLASCETSLTAAAVP